MTNISNVSSKEIHKHLTLEYRKSLMKVEMEVFQARQTRMTDNIQRYFNSTPIRNAFARWMVYAFYENEFYTISRIVKEMRTNRQTVSVMISECENENCILVQRKGKTVACQASPLLVKKMDDYCDWRKELIKRTIDQSYNDLNDFEKLMNKI